MDRNRRPPSATTYVRYLRALGKIQITVAVGIVLRVFLEDVERPRYGYDPMKATCCFPSGKLYPILARLEGAGWLERQWEDVDAAVVGRPARRWYRLSKDGAEAAWSELAALQRQLAPPSVGFPGKPRPVVGTA